MSWLCLSLGAARPVSRRSNKGHDGAESGKFFCGTKTSTPLHYRIHLVIYPPKNEELKSFPGR